MKLSVLLVILCLALSCKKEEATNTFDGTYLVNTKDESGYRTNGNIVISGNNLTLSGNAWSTHTTTITPSGMNFTINKGGAIKLGSGTVNDNEITGFVQIIYSGGIDEIEFNGFK